MSIFEELFNSAILDVLVPDTSVQFPDQSVVDEWLSKVTGQKVDRKQAFFDEQLQSLLLIRISNPSSFSDSPLDPTDPPPSLISFLSHLQIALEAKFISPHPTSLSPPPPAQNERSISMLSAPPRSDSVGRVKPQPLNSNPSIFPPATPNPTPSTTETDRQYVQAEGTLLLASIWGQGQSGVATGSRENVERFTLLWSEKEQIWVAIYRLVLTVSFLRLTTTEPLLCLTVSATLREKPLPATTQPNHPFLQYLNTISDLRSVVASPTSPSSQSQSQSQWQSSSQAQSPTTTSTPVPQTEIHAVTTGLEEVNLLSGLAAGPNFPSSGERSVYLPSTRLGNLIRRSAFSLSPSSVLSSSSSNLGKGPSTQTQASASPGTRLTAAPATSHPTLRKSFRKTLRTVSGFRVRMRTVFVPYVFLPGDRHGQEQGQDDEEHGLTEAGNEERTVVLCVEVENSGESGQGVGFCVDSVDVNIGGEGARAILLGWGDYQSNGGAGIFPIKVDSMEQYNLLYAVSFLQNPEDVDGVSLVGGTYQRIGKEKEKGPQLQRAVTIHINGRPFVKVGTDGDDGEGKRDEDRYHDKDKEKESKLSVSYPTQPFSSRWNCILDLSPQSYRPSGDPSFNDLSASGKDVLPEPPSPFPMSQSRTQSRFQWQSPRTATMSNFSQPQDRSLAIAGDKRYTLPGPAGAVGARAVGGIGGSLTPQRSPKAYVPPSNTVQSQTSYLASPTTYGPPLHTGGTPRSSLVYDSPGARDSVAGLSPVTPAYPPFTSRSPSSSAPRSHGPISSLQNGGLGPSVEIKRGITIDTGVLQSPGPMVAGAERGTEAQQGTTNEDEGEPIVISVGLLTPPSLHSKGAKIYPLDTFTLDIFVFNQSKWTRRFEISYPDRRTRRKQNGQADAGERGAGIYNRGRKDSLRGFGDGDQPGILPLENRVRIGPLRPSTCQSVRMDFLAITPGVHSIDILTLTDIVTGYTMNLRSVMDVVVHERLEL